MRQHSLMHETHVRVLQATDVVVDCNKPCIYVVCIGWYGRVPAAYVQTLELITIMDGGQVLTKHQTL
jgi:hypothetical protein